MGIIFGGNRKKKEQKHKPLTSEELETLLKENTFKPGDDSKYPYYLVQLSDKEELPYKGKYVSDAIAAHISSHNFSHLIIQTHGWNTPPEKAIAVPFTEFMRGMQNDRAMPTPEEGFNPIFIAFIWPALPLEFTSSQDALTRTELLAQFENEHPATDASTDIAQAAEAAAQALEVNDPDHPQLNNGLHRLAEASKDEIGPDEHVEQMINRLKTEAAEGVEEEKDDDGNIIVGGVTNILRAIMGPFETLVFSRLMRRGQATGEVMGRLIGKFMRASTGHLKVCLMANSLGVHVLCGVLNNPDNLPYKLHTVFHVQGAIRSDLFSPSERFGSLHHNVAGPVVCTFSEHDRLLRIMFGLFHGPAVGLGGSPVGRKIVVKGLDELANTPYEFLCGHWNNVDCSKYIDEGSFFAGGHGDFKEDETTSLYWAAIKTPVEDSLYDK